MRFGCCVSMSATPADPAGLARLEACAAAGFDYVELPIAEVMQLDDAAFQQLVEKLDWLKLPCESCNNFFPRSVRLTGAERNWGAIREYLLRALTRVKALGARTIVFGSVGAKNVPAGFSMEEAWEQIYEATLLISDLLHQVDDGIRVALEPVCRREANILLNYSEGLALAKRVNRENIRCLVDLYHMDVEKEPMEHLLEGEGMLQHVHISNPEGRIYPREGDGQPYSRFFDVLRSIGYDGRASVEAYTQNFSSDALQAIACLRALDAGKAIVREGGE